MRLDARSVLVLFSLAAGCSLVRAPLFDPELDAGGIDAPLADVPGLDVPGLDVPGLDAPPPDVPGLDAPEPPDAGMPDTPDAGCTPVPETCNGRDDNCDGATDEGTVCRMCVTPGSCSDCVGFEAGGRTYQSCPLVTGYRYWGRVCSTLGGGYDLAVPDEPGENDAITERLRNIPGLASYHWIGVNDFEADGSYLTVQGNRIDATSRLAATGGSHDYEGALILQPFTSNWEDWPLITSFRALCELDTRSAPCVSSTGDGDGCNQQDDDCDGFWDEDCPGSAECTSRVFWDRVYYVCTDDLTQPEAGDACRELGGARLSVIDNRFELAFADDFANADTWVGLRQDPTGMGPDGWRWLDTPWTSSDPEWSVLWDTAMPSTATDEDCGFIKNSSGRLQDHGCDSNRASSLCEARF